MASAGDRTIRSVAVLGGGIVGLSAALAFARALPQVRVTIVATPPDPAALADRLPGTLPGIARFHALIGLTEQEVLRAGAATHRLGTRIAGWSGDDAAWVQVHGQYGAPAGSIPFHQLWARAWRAGEALPYYRYSAAAVLALADRFVHPEDDPRSPLSTYDYALRLDPPRYRALLARLAELRGIGLVPAAELGSERRGDGGVAALLLEGGRRIEADLFLDCAGPSAPLRTPLGGAFEDWSDLLPCDRLLIGHGPARPPSPRDDVAATASGWRSTTPLPDHELHLAASVGTLAGVESPLPPEVAVDETIALRPGRRRDPWRHNVLAIGDAAVALDPLQHGNLDTAQAAIRRALDLLPGRDCHPLELREYNRRADLATERLRDFLALHYARAPRLAGWHAGPVPDSLAQLLDQFARRGRLVMQDEDPIPEESWIAALIGLGVVPQTTAPLAAAIDPAATAAWMRGIAEGMATLPGQLPAYPDYLARCRSVSS